MPAPQIQTLEPIIASHQMRHVLYEAAHAARVVLKVDASIIFLLSTDNVLTAAAWHGREAGDIAISLESQYIKALWASRRSITWYRRDRCMDVEIGAVLDNMGLVSGLVVPLVLDRLYYGVWLAATSSERSFTESDETILHTLSENIALTTESMILSMDNLRLQREANALYEIGKEISQLMDLNRVLKAIAEKTCSLMGAELSYIALADDKRQEVRVVVTEGTRGDLLGKMVLKYGEGVGGAVAATREPQLVDSYPKDPRPKPPGVAEMAASEDIQAIISVPMVTRNGLIGVLFAASRREAVFNHSQMDLLFALGTQAAIAIENARLYEQEKVTAEKLQVSMETGDKLLHLVLRNQGLQAITDTLSELVSSPILIEDNRHRVLSLSDHGFKGKQEGQTLLTSLSSFEVWSDPEMIEPLRVLREARQSIRVPPRLVKGIFLSRVIVPIVAGDNLLGYVTALEIGHTLNEIQRAAVEQASIVIALEFLKQESAQAVEQRLAGDFLDDVISGRCANDPAVFQRAARLNVDLRRQHRIMVLDVDQFAEVIASHHWTDMDALAIKRRFFRTVTEMVRNDAPGTLVGMQSDSVLLMMPVNSTSGVREVIAFGKKIQGSLQVALPDLSFSIGIGRTADDHTKLPRSFQEAQLALCTAALSQNRQCIVAYEELGIMPLLLQSQNQAELMAFMQRYLGALLAYDAGKDTSLVPTLQAYLSNNGHMQRTADDCHIHVNTLKYRMQRIEEITGLHLDDGEVRFNLQLALSIHSAMSILGEKKV